jgi:hypothetical protein
MAVSLAGMPASATDYSTLYKPSFARLGVLTSERVLQAECAGLAIHLAGVQPASYKTAAARLHEAVSRRLSADLGDGNDGRMYVEGKAHNYASSAFDPQTIKGIIDIMEPKCRVLIAKAKEGERALSKALGPVPTAPLELPGSEQCIAVLTYGIEREVEVLEGADEFVTVLRKDMLGVLAPDEATKLTARITKGVEDLRAHAPDDDQLSRTIFSCFPTVHEAAMRLQEAGGGNC